MGDESAVQRVRHDSPLVRNVPDAVEEVLSSEGDDPVAAIYLYGSAVARSLTKEEHGGREVDVHDLAGLPLAVRGRVLTEGVLVLSTDEDRRVRFEELTRRRYFDFLPFQERDTEEGLRGLRERIDGG